MTTHFPRPPYSKEELQTLYPPSLELTQVHVFLRHGERTPVSQRLVNAGLPGFWPFCSALGNKSNSVLLPDYHPPGGHWHVNAPAAAVQAQTLYWTQKLETWSADSDSPALAYPGIRQGGPDVSNSGGNGNGNGNGVVRGIMCEQGMLTDRGRETTTALGQRLRQLYVRDLGFLPAVFTPGFARDEAYFRSTAVPRAVESLMQTVGGLWPSGRWDSGEMHARPASSSHSSSFFPLDDVEGDDHGMEKTKLGWNQAAGLSSLSSHTGHRPVTPRTAFGSFKLDVVTRQSPDEDLYPNDFNCRRFAHLSRAFASRAAERWNDSPEMAYLTDKMGKWMPTGEVKVDNKPRLTGLMDTINATKAHDPAYMASRHRQRDMETQPGRGKGQGARRDEDETAKKKPGWDVFPVGRVQPRNGEAGSSVTLPAEFYDEKAMKHIEKITVDEWYSGFTESQEYRLLGIGSLMGDVVERMVRGAESLSSSSSSPSPFSSSPSSHPRDSSSSSSSTFSFAKWSHASGKEKEEKYEEEPGQQKSLRFSLNGCHDTTLAAIVGSLGVFDMRSWPPFTSHVAIELFRDPISSRPQPPHPPSYDANEDIGDGMTYGTSPPPLPPSTVAGGSNVQGQHHHSGAVEKIEQFFHLHSHSDGNEASASASSAAAATTPIGRRKTNTLSPEEQNRLNGYYVRVRYNDEPMFIPGCKPEGNHWKDDEGLCTLKAFKSIVDKFTPDNWKNACMSNKGAPEFPEKPEPAGY